MSPDEIKHFLVSYDLDTGKTEVEVPRHRRRRCTGGIR